MKTQKENLKKKITIVLFFLSSIFVSGPVFAAPDATMIIANPGEDASTEMRISWHTNVGVVGSFVEYTKKTDTSWANVKKVVGTYTLSTTWNGITSIISSAAGSFTQDIQVYKYGAVLSNLDPGTEYMYRVGLAEVSDTRYFKTAGSSEYKFSWISDYHAYDPLPQRLTAAMSMVTRTITAAGSGGVDFILSTGDDVAYGGSYTYWQNIFAHDLYKKYMWVTMIGNHDHMDRTDSNNKDAYYHDTHNNPRNGFAGQEGCSYWFKYGNVLWIILNSMDQAVSSAQVDKARAWLEKVVQDNEGQYQYLFVCQHYQWFAGETGSSNSSGYTRWCSTFDKCGVDIAFSGNNHIYVRSKAVYNEQASTDPTKGTVYIQAPSSDNDRGSTMNESLSSNADKIAARFTEGTYTVGGSLVTVSNNKINVRLYDRNGVLKDEADIPAKRMIGQVIPSVSFVDAGTLSAVDIKKPFNLTFNCKMDKASVESAISFSPAATASYTWLNDYTLSMDISKLEYATGYALTISGSIAKDLEGTFLAGAGGTAGTDYVLNFTTATPKIEANIFASELKASSVTSTDDVTFTYTLNTPASEVEISVSNGDVFTINSGDGLAKGVNSVTKKLNVSTAGGNYTWSVKATGFAANTNTGAAPVKFTDDNETEMKYYSPRGGIVMDKNPDSPYFGRLYIANSLSGTTGGRTTPDGIYILNAALQNITGQGDTPYLGGQTWVYNGTTADLTPYRLSVTQEGKILIPKNWTSAPGIWIMDPANPGSNFTAAFGSTSIYGRPIQSYLIDNDLYVFDESYSGGTYRISRYENFAPGHTAAPTVTVFANPSSIISPSVSAGNAIAGFVPDGNDGWWISQRTTTTTETATNPSLIHIDSSGTIDFNSFSNITSANRIGQLNRAALAYNKDENLIAVACSNLVKVFSVIWTEDVPSIPNAPLYSISVPSSTSGNIDGLEFDPAGNLYVISSASERLTVWTLPKANAAANTFTTNAPTANPVAVGINNTPFVTGIKVLSLGNRQISIISEDAIQSVKLLNLQGKTIASKKGVSNNRCQLDAPDKGIYIVEVITKAGRNTQKIAVY